MANNLRNVLEQIREQPMAALGEDRILAALDACDHPFRDRKLPPPKLLSLMLAQAAHGCIGIEGLKHHAGMDASPQAFSRGIMGTVPLTMRAGR